MVFLFDENVPHKFVEGLASIESSNHRSSIRAKVLHPQLMDSAGCSDEEQIAIAGKHKAIIVTFDKDFKHLKSYYPLYREHKVGVVFLKLTKQESNYWGIVRLIINRWEDLKQKLAQEQKPFAFQIAHSGIQRFEF